MVDVTVEADLGFGSRVNTGRGISDNFRSIAWGNCMFVCVDTGLDTSWYTIQKVP